MQKRISKGEAVFIVVNYIFLFLCVLITLLPFATIIAKSFSDSAAIESGKVFLWPVDFNTQAYKNLISDGQLLRSMKNTVIITVVGTFLNMVFTTTAAYALSKKRLLGGKTIMKLMTFTKSWTYEQVRRTLASRTYNGLQPYSYENIFRANARKFGGGGTY